MRQRWIYSAVMVIVVIAILHFTGVFDKPLGEALVWCLIVAIGLGLVFGLTARWLRLGKAPKAN